MKFTDQKVGPESRPKLPALGVKGIPDSISILVDQYRVTGY